MKVQEIAQLLLKIVHVIDTTDPDCVYHLDSGADSIAELLDLQDEIRDAVFELTGQYPAVEKEDYDLDTGGRIH